MYDIAIIGAGPAGATLGRLLEKRYKILILEMRRLGTPDAPGKCCGGLLAPMAQKELAVQGIGLPREVLCSPQIFAVKTMDLATGRMGYYQRHYINLDRGRFERYLFGIIKNSFDVRCGCVAHCIEKRENMQVIHFTSEGRQYTEEARMIVAADGGASMIRRHAASMVHNSTQYIAMQEWHKADNLENCFHAFFDSDVTDYYAWAIPKDGAILIGAALPWQKDAPQRFTILKEKLVQAGIIPAGKPWKMESAPVMRPEKPSQILTQSSDVAFAGEAGGWISSSSSEGIGPALYSGRVLSECINSHFGEKDCLRHYEHMMRGERGKLASKIAKGKIICNEWMRNLLIGSHLSQIQVSQTAPAQQAFI